MHALVLAILIAHGAPSSDPAPSSSKGSGVGTLGVGLLAAGTGLAATTAAGVTLMQAITAPDDNRNKPAHPEITQVSGFVTVALGSLSAGMILVGGALVLHDVLPPAPAASPTV